MWNDEKVEYLRLHWGVDRTATIAADLGVASKNAIIGKARRLGLTKLQPGTHRTKFAPGKGMIRPPRAQPLRAKLAQTLPEPVPYIAPPPPAADVARVLSVLGLEAHHCRWPVQAGFCGCQKTRGSYCAAHNDRAWAKRRDGSQPMPVSFGIYRSRLIT